MLLLAAAAVLIDEGAVVRQRRVAFAGRLCAFASVRAQINGVDDGEENERDKRQAETKKRLQS